MHRRVLPVLVASTVTLGLVGLAGPAAVADNQHPKKQMLTLYGVQTAFTGILATGEVFTDEEPDQPPTAGARFVEVDTLYSDAEHTAEVGRNDISCVFTETTGSEGDFGANVLCNGVVTIIGQGTLAWQGTTSFGPDSEESPETPFITVALTGGTGAFTAAGGQASIFDVTPRPAGEEEPEEVLSRYDIELLTFKTTMPAPAPAPAPPAEPAPAPTTPAEPIVTPDPETPDTGGQWVPIDEAYYEGFSGPACGSTVTVTGGDLRQTEMRVTSLPDGSTLREIRGELTVDVVRESDGATLDELDVSGVGFELGSEPTEDGKVVITAGLEGRSIVLAVDPLQAESLMEAGLPEFLFFSGGQITTQDVLQLAEAEDEMPTTIMAKVLSNTATGVEDVCKMLDAAVQ